MLSLDTKYGLSIALHVLVSANFEEAMACRVRFAVGAAVPDALTRLSCSFPFSRLKDLDAECSQTTL